MLLERNQSVLRAIFTILIAAACAFFAATPALCREGDTSFLIAGVTPVTPEGKTFIQPLWAPDGQHIAFSGPHYRGIWCAEADGKGMHSLTAKPMAGFRFAWAPDSRSIVCRIRDKNGLRILQLDIEGNARPLTAPAENLSTPQLQGARLVCRSDGKTRLLSEAAGEAASPECMVFARKGLIICRRHGKERTLSDNRDTYYLPVISPDGRWVAYEGLASGIHLHRLDGGEKVHAGRGNRPSWSPDSSAIIYEISDDDGEKILSSDLYLFHLVARSTRRLTNTPRRIERHPAWAPDGERIVWDEGGRIYTGIVTEK